VEPPTSSSAPAADGSPHPERDRPSFERDVRQMFTHIAGRYEWFDHVATFGNDFLWRVRALWDLPRRSPITVRRALDVGCGTGEFVRAVAHRFPGAEVWAVDFTRAMVVRAAESGVERSERAGFARATALRLPFPDATFDLVTNGFLLRNLAQLDPAFREMRRVLRPGGVLLSLELGEPPNALFARMFHAYFDHVVPLLGRATGSEGPYRYLPESLRSLPPRPELLATLRRCGFPRCTADPMSRGIVTAFFAEAGGAPDQSR
jgi:demethylmenaquinone methyltransferase / 2-methoxy-6-polyprenyl-1,4-benzoquinol methylase